MNVYCRYCGPVPVTAPCVHVAPHIKKTIKAIKKPIWNIVERKRQIIRKIKKWRLFISLMAFALLWFAILGTSAAAQYESKMKILTTYVMHETKIPIKPELGTVVSILTNWDGIYPEYIIRYHSWSDGIEYTTTVSMRSKSVFLTRHEPTGNPGVYHSIPIGLQTWTPLNEVGGR